MEKKKTNQNETKTKMTDTPLLQCSNFVVSIRSSQNETMYIKFIVLLPFGSVVLSFDSTGYDLMYLTPMFRELLL